MRKRKVLLVPYEQTWRLTPFTRHPANKLVAASTETMGLDCLRRYDAATGLTVFHAILTVPSAATEQRLWLMCQIGAVYGASVKPPKQIFPIVSTGDFDKFAVIRPLVPPKWGHYSAAHDRRRRKPVPRLKARELRVMANAISGQGGSAGAVDIDYRPSEAEEFMNARQLAYFRKKLLDWKESILKESQDTLNTLQNEPLREPDLTDRASCETDWSIELRTRDRQRKLISKIDSALRRIDEGEYGYCEVTGEPISLGRLEARPIATMTVEAQEAHERHEKISRDE